MADTEGKRLSLRAAEKLPYLVLCALFPAVSVPLAGCGGPTYGTGVSSSQQMVNDFSNITKWGSLSNSNSKVDSSPRPPLVPPTAADLSKPLPPPQESLAASNNPQWPESPEQRRARLRAEATANRNNQNYVSPIIQDEAQTPSQTYTSNGLDRTADRNAAMPSPAVAKEQEARYKQLKAENSPENAAKTRKYLTQPPLEYFKPSPNAPIGDPGESEDEKKQNKKNERTSIFGD